MRTVARTEGIVNKEITKARQRRSKLIDIGLRALNFLTIDDTLTFLCRMEAQILE